MGIFTDRIKKELGSMKNKNIPVAPAPRKIVSEEEIKSTVFLLFLQNKEMFNGLKEFKNSAIFWQNVVCAICFAESNLNQYERYFEKTMGYYSEGLMQLSYEDCKNYYFPLDKNKDEIFIIENNLKLGMIILNHLVLKHGDYIFNDSNYWAVLQPKNSRHQVFLNKFNEYQRGTI